MELNHQISRFRYDIKQQEGWDGLPTQPAGLYMFSLAFASKVLRLKVFQLYSNSH